MFNITDIFMLFALIIMFAFIIYAFMLERKERIMDAVIADYEQRLKELEKEENQMPELTLEYIQSLYWEDGLTMDERGTNLLKEGEVLTDMVFKVKDCDPTEFHAVLLYHENTYWLYEYEKHSGNDDFTALCLYPLNECRTDLRAFNRIKSSNV